MNYPSSPAAKPTVVTPCALAHSLAPSLSLLSDVGDVEEIMADLDENMNEVNEVGDILSQPQFDNGMDEVGTWDLTLDINTASIQPSLCA